MTDSTEKELELMKEIMRLILDANLTPEQMKNLATGLILGLSGLVDEVQGK